MRRINKCVYEYSEIQFISFQLQKPSENIATALTICCAAAAFPLTVHQPLLITVASHCKKNFVNNKRLDEQFFMDALLL